ncbi:hypothetical protein [Enterococcus gallinarum]|uniref:hypothetical protein n=1 Tax=Enterococcus gallinarum TaxID=1353 RepID=UPI0032E46AE0
MVPKFRCWDEIARETFSNTTEIYRHKPKGMLTNLYHKMNHRNKKNGYGDLAFTLNDFKDWAFKSEEFLYLFDVWVQSGYSKKFKPSVDRKNPYKGYQFDNMQWMFWFNNYQKGINEVAKKKRKPILMYKEGMYLGKFKSIEDAREFLGMKSNGDIVMVLQGKRDKVKGYTFIYENPELLEQANEN